METKYTMTVTFTASRPLDLNELESIASSIAPQVEEPILIVGDDHLEAEYETHSVSIVASDDFGQTVTVF